MSLRAISGSRWPGYWVTLLTIWATCGALSLTGCSTRPPQRVDGMPIVPRYTTAIQLDWMLDGYTQVAVSAAQSGQKEALLDEACLGWERAIFDLESVRRYPSFLRMSTESANIMTMLGRYPEIVRRHPRPAACDGVTPPAPASPAAPASPVAVTPSPSPEVSGLAQAAPPPVENQGAAPTAAPSAAAPAATPPVQSAPPPRSPVAAPALPSTSPMALERQLLARLRTALGMSLEPSAPTSSVSPPSAAPPVDMATLGELAQSEVLTIRLRARYHLLGQCVLATERADRSWVKASGEALEGAICVGRAAREPLRMVQKRLTRSMLQAWRGRSAEPFGDLAIALASFASRDNPNLDGPRIGR
jgi:hypothetical protein